MHVTVICVTVMCLCLSCVWYRRLYGTVRCILFHCLCYCQVYVTVKCMLLSDVRNSRICVTVFFFTVRCFYCAYVTVVRMSVGVCLCQLCQMYITVRCLLLSCTWYPTSGLAVSVTLPLTLETSPHVSSTSDLSVSVTLSSTAPTI